MATLYDIPTVPALRTIIERVGQGDILIPEFQRPFVWDEEQRINLLDSIAQGLPIGSFLLWRTQRSDTKTHTVLGELVLESDPKKPTKHYLLDGLQRLTTLYTALTPPPSKSVFWESDGGRWPLWIELSGEHPIFTIPRKSSSLGPTQVPSWILLSNYEVFQAQRELWKGGFDAEAKQLERLSNIFKDYAIPLIPLVTEDLSVVTRAFARINSGGTSMSEAHMLRALVFGRAEDDVFGERLTRWEERFNELGWSSINRDAILNSLKLSKGMDVYRADMEELLHALTQQDGEALEDAAAFVNDACRSIECAITFFMEELHVLGSQVLPYRYQLLLLAEALSRASIRSLDKLSDEVRALLSRWFWQTSYGESFTGATGSNFKTELERLAQALDGQQYFDEPVRVRPVQRQRWKAVRTVLQALVAALEVESEDDGHALKLLALSGSDAVYKIDPKLQSNQFSSWVIATPEELRELRAWLQDDELPTPLCAHQLAPDAVEAFRAGDLEGFAAQQQAHIDAMEAEYMSRYGLVRE